MQIAASKEDRHCKHVLPSQPHIILQASRQRLIALPARTSILPMIKHFLCVHSWRVNWLLPLRPAVNRTVPYAPIPSFALSPSPVGPRATPSPPRFQARTRPLARALVTFSRPVFSYQTRTHIKRIGSIRDRAESTRP